MDGFEQTNFAPNCDVDDRWRELQSFTITEYELARQFDLLGQLLLHFSEEEISQFEAVELIYVDRNLKLYVRTVSTWNPECQVRPELSKAQFF